MQTNISEWNSNANVSLCLVSKAPNSVNFPQSFSKLGKKTAVLLDGNHLHDYWVFSSKFLTVGDFLQIRNSSEIEEQIAKQSS